MRVWNCAALKESEKTGVPTRNKELLKKKKHVQCQIQNSPDWKKNFRVVELC